MIRARVLTRWLETRVADDALSLCNTTIWIVVARLSASMMEGEVFTVQVQGGRVTARPAMHRNFSKP